MGEPRSGRNGIRRALIYLAGGAMQKAAAFLLVPFFTRAMPPAEFGKLSFWLAVFAAMQIISGLGIDAAVNRLFHDHSSDGHRQRSFLASMLAWRWLLAWAVVPLLYLMGKMLGPAWLADQALDPYLGIVLAAAAMQAVIDTILAAHRTSQRAGRFMGVVLMSTILLILMNLLFVGYFRWDAKGALLATLGATSVTAAVASVVFFTSNRPARWRAGFLLPALKYGLPTVPQKIGSWLNNLSNRVLIAQLASLTAVAQYQLAYTGGAILTLFVTSVNSAYVPWYYQKRIAGKLEKTTVAMLDFAIIAAIGSTCVGLVLFASEFIRIFAPASYQSAETLVPAIAAGCFVFAQYTQFLKVLHFHKRTGLASAAVMIPGLLTIPVNLLVIPSLGALGAAWVTYGAFGLTLVAVIYLSRQLEDEGHNLYGLTAANALILGLALLSPIASQWSSGSVLTIMVAKAVAWFLVSMLLVLMLCGRNVKALLTLVGRSA